MRASFLAVLSLVIPLVACGGSDGGTSAPVPGGAKGDDGAGAANGGGSSGSSSSAAKPVESGPYPIVLMHGMAGFAKLQNLPLDVVYFDGVAADLSAHGEGMVYTTLAPPYDSSEERAKALAPQIDDILKKTGKSKVNLIGHSQGGLDARVLASAAGLGYGDRIASVTTIATPHRGSGVADLVLGLTSGVPDNVFDQVTGVVVNLLQKSVYEIQSDPHLHAQMQEMSAQYMSTVFNPKYQDDPRVVYGSYAGRTNFETGVTDCAGAAFPDDPSHVDAAQPALAPTAIFLEEGQGKANDGLVPVASARWGKFLQCVPADHLKEVGLLVQQGKDPVSSFDHLAFFRDVVARLRSQGF